VRVRALLGRLALAAASSLAAVVLAEVGLAVADYPPSYSELRLFIEYDSVRGWRNIPNARRQNVTPEFTVDLEYNARAYRGPVHEYVKPAGTYRVLLIGDSDLEGYSVALEDRVAEVAEAMLRHEPGGRPVEVVALGTSGYSTDQELLWLEGEGLRYNPDLVVVLFNLNDIWYNTRNQYPLGPKPAFRLAGDGLVLTNVPVPRLSASVSSGAAATNGPWRAVRRFIHQRSRLVWLAERATRRTAWLQGFGMRVGLINAPAATVQGADGRVTVPAEYAVFADSLTPQADSALTVTAKLLARMESRTRGAGGQFVVGLNPATEELYPPGAPQSVRFHRTLPFRVPLDRPSERFREICRRARVRCVDPTARYVVAAQALPPGVLLVFPLDGHWNEHGHRVAAGVIADLVRDAVRR
jgi:GDSL-like Lipase/Acylhydrolase family